MVRNRWFSPRAPWWAIRNGLRTAAGFVMRIARDTGVSGRAGGPPKRVFEYGATVNIARREGAAYFIRTEAGESKVYLSKPIGAAPRRLDHVKLPDGNTFLIDVSADGRNGLVASATALWIVPLVPGTAGPSKFPSAYPPVRWLPDGRHFVESGSLNPEVAPGSC